MWQYLVEIRVPFAILMVVFLVAVGYGACWLLSSRRERQRRERAEQLLAQQHQRHEAVEAQSQKRLNDMATAEAENKKRITELEETARRLGQELSEKKAEIAQARRSEPAGPPAQQQAETGRSERIITRSASSQDKDSAENGATEGISGEVVSGPAGTVSHDARPAFRTIAGPSLFVAYRVTVTDDPALNFPSRWVNSGKRSVNVTVEYADIPADYSSGVSEIFRQHRAARSGGKLKDALNEYTAKKFVNAAWKELDARQVTVDPGGVDAAAQAIVNFQDGVHKAILEKPTLIAAGRLGLPEPASALAGGVIAEIPLPIDRPLKWAERSVYVAEIVIGMVPPLHPLAVHGIQRLTHDLAISGLKNALTHLEAAAPPTARPTPPDTSPRPPGRPTPASGPSAPAPGSSVRPPGSSVPPWVPPTPRPKGPGAPGVSPF